MSVTTMVVSHKLNEYFSKRIIHYPNTSKPKEILSDEIIETKTFH